MDKHKTNNSKKTHLLLILDGWGNSSSTEKNAIANGNTPNWDRLLKTYPNSALSCSGMDVGLPPGQMGNSEVGHMNIGAGRIVYQDYTRINKSIQDSQLRENKVLTNAITNTVNNNRAIHFMGLLSKGGVHSHENQLHAMLDLCEHLKAKKVYLHVFLDGRDTPPKSAKPSLERLEDRLSKLRNQGMNAQILSIGGRFFAMDRDHRWDRVQAAYEAIAEGKAQHVYQNAFECLEAAYERGETDEFVCPSIIRQTTQHENETPSPSDLNVGKGDALIFFNFRADRAREITEAFTANDFNGFERTHHNKLGHFVMMTQYADHLKADCAFPPTTLANTLPEVLAQQNKTQLRIAETEKYAHVTFFFSGGKEAKELGETRILIPSPDVKTYDLQPEMSLPELTEKLCTAIKSGKYDAVICNIANGDMLGHTGNYEAALKAVSAVDDALLQIEQAILDSGSECLITADHGNIEQMTDTQTHQPHTAHTCNLVPLVYIGRIASIRSGGNLSDLAPTILTLMGLSPSPEMTGKSLIELLKT